MKVFLKVIVLVVIAGVLAACMNTSDDEKESETNEQNNTNNEQTEEEYNQDDPDEQKDFDRNNDYKNNKDRHNQRNSNRNKDRKHHKDHHKRGERTQTNKNNQEEIVLENEAFQIFEPAPKAKAKDQLIVRGLARVFEGTIQYKFEDNHSTLDEGYTTASLGAPEWGEFEIIIEVDKSAHHSARIVLYEESAKDGSKMNELIIPVQVNQ